MMTHLETKSAARVKEHAEFIAHHEQVIREIDDKLMRSSMWSGGCRAGSNRGRASFPVHPHLSARPATQAEIRHCAVK